MQVDTNAVMVPRHMGLQNINLSCVNNRSKVQYQGVYY